MSIWFTLLIQFSILGFAILAGVFLAFSDFIMRSLALTSGTGGIEAMQVINREVFRWVFMALFLGLVPVSLILVGYGLISLDGTARTMIVLAGVVYLIGSFGVTIRFNVPMNEMLAGMETGHDITKTYWSDVYLPRWVFWNSVRTAACAACAILLMIGVLN
ncbi:MAG: DUF1772 domain-containing protein [Roseovarius sp.]|nr:DUF1772 domain-containing protein [Roseovarius sp.]